MADQRGPLYAHIEFCRNAETLWNKLQSGNWDWLGVHPSGNFVLGRPPVGGRMVASVSLQTIKPGVKEGEHGVRYQEWTGTPGLEPASEWFSNAGEAKARYEQLLERYRNQTPILAQIQLIEKKWVADEEFIATPPPPNYRGGRPKPHSLHS